MYPTARCQYFPHGHAHHWTLYGLPGILPPRHGQSFFPVDGSLFVKAVVFMLQVGSFRFRDLCLFLAWSSTTLGSCGGASLCRNLLSRGLLAPECATRQQREASAFGLEISRSLNGLHHRSLSITITILKNINS